MKKIIILSSLLIALAGCKSKNAETVAETDKTVNGTLPRQPYFEIIKQESYGGRQTESHEHVTSQQQLDALYKELNIETAAPTVDFEKKHVVALFMGEKTTGGYSIGIENIKVAKEYLTIKTKKTSPGGMATMALTNPYCIAYIPKTKKVVVE